ncbi:glycoside hydrolase family 16 protein [Gordonia sp. NPDC003429]
MLDDFSGTAGAAPKSSLWNYDVGGGGWGNGEWQTYTSARANSRLNGSGQLIIEARSDGSQITSARLRTSGKFEFTYGTLEARIKMPAGAGLHPAFWLMGSDIGTVGWPRCGEIDIIETVNSAVTWHTALHGPTTTAAHWQAQQQGIAALANSYHVYGVRRSPGSVSMTVDGKTVSTFTQASLPAGAQWVFDKPMFALLNLAVGGTWPGAPNSTTPNPSQMLVDWTRYTPA